MVELKFDWQFWIGFDARHGPDGGGVAVDVTAEALDEAITAANTSAIRTVELLDSDGDNVGIYFTTDNPFGRHNLAMVSPHAESDGVTRMHGEDEGAWLSRVGDFLAECRELDDDE